MLHRHQECLLDQMFIKWCSDLKAPLVLSQKRRLKFVLCRHVNDTAPYCFLTSNPGFLLLKKLPETAANQRL